MFGLFQRRTESNGFKSRNGDVAKLFFDTFSKRIAIVEEGLRGFSSELDKLRMAVDRSQISDLVLLERLQKAEGLLKESMSWIRQIAETSARKSERGVPTNAASQGTIGTLGGDDMDNRVQRTISLGTILTPTGDLGTLPSITTPTELQVLTLLANEGPKSAPEIGRVVGRSREHTARLMKKLFEEGYILRDQSRVPFRYSLVERVKQSFTKPEAKVEGKEAISLPQT
jgi:hypothetical protein